MIQALLLMSCQFCSFPIASPVAQEDHAKPAFYEKNLLNALFQEQVQGELELVDEQKVEIQQKLLEVRKRQAELQSELQEYQRGGATREELLAKRSQFVDEFEAYKTERQSNILAVLLPHQKQRLRETAAQLMIRDVARKQKTATPILVPEMRAFLDIDDQQAVRIKKKAEKLQKELMEEFKKLQQQAQTELMAELTEAQKSKYKKLIGDPIQSDR